MCSDSFFSQTRSSPPSPSLPPSPSPQSLPASPPSPPSPSTTSIPTSSSPPIFTTTLTSPVSSQSTSAPNSQAPSAESSIFDLSLFFSLNPRPAQLTRDQTSMSGMSSPSPPTSEAGTEPQSISQSISSSPSVASENFRAPGGTWSITTEEYPRSTGSLQPNSQMSSSEESLNFFTNTTSRLPSSILTPFSRYRGGWRIGPSSSESSETSPESAIYLAAPATTSPVVLQDAVGLQGASSSSSSDTSPDNSDYLAAPAPTSPVVGQDAVDLHDASRTGTGFVAQSGSRTSVYFSPLSSPVVSQADDSQVVEVDTPSNTFPNTTNPPLLTSFNPPPTPILQIRMPMPGSWITSRSSSPIPSPLLSTSSSQPSAQTPTQTTSNPYPSPILQVTIMPGSWVSLPNSPSPPSSPVGEVHRDSVPLHASSTPATPITPTAPTSCSTSTILIKPTGNDTDNTREITITIAGLNIYSSPTDTSTSINTNTSNNENTINSAKSSSNVGSSGSEHSNATKGTNTTEGSTPSLTRSSSSSSSSSSLASSTGSTLPACIQQ